MFNFVEKFFKGRPEKHQAQLNSVPKRKSKKTIKKSAGIAYDSGLIQNLEEDHNQLVNIFGKIWSEGYEDANYTALTDYLAQFKALFQSHLLKENVKFYAYLELSMRRDEHSLSVVREFRKDMNDIANAVIGFCKKYDDPKTLPAQLEQFKEDYQGIGQALVRRVQLEERDLYSLYGPA